MPSRLIFMDLLGAVYWFDEALQEQLSARGWTRLTRAQSLVLLNIAIGIQRASEIAKNIGVSRQAMSQMLAEMQTRELIAIEADPTDRRAQLVVFSGTSAAIRDDAVQILSALEAELSKRIGTRKFLGLREALAADWGASGGNLSVRRSRHGKPG
ncbi:MAG: MarR family transcriptional regulator [Pseudomonadota bacterium]|nr:MarR family transcriptional regulator [Pseudomonadota bacterium]